MIIVLVVISVAFDLIDNRAGGHFGGIITTMAKVAILLNHRKTERVAKNLLLRKLRKEIKKDSKKRIRVRDNLSPHCAP